MTNKEPATPDDGVVGSFAWRGARDRRRVRQDGLRETAYVRMEHGRVLGWGPPKVPERDPRGRSGGGRVLTAPLAASAGRDASGCSGAPVRQVSSATRGAPAGRNTLSQPESLAAREFVQCNGALAIPGYQ